MTKIIVFDLDDTLYKEIDFLKSGYRAICSELGVDCFQQMMDWYYAGENVFQRLCKKYSGKTTVDKCLSLYRNHEPVISLDADTITLLSQLKRDGAVLGLVSDGREVTQWNKIKALGLEQFFDREDVVISETFGSEKPCPENFKYFMQKYPNALFVYVGDNVNKDFVAPNKLGWTTFCLIDDGRNIHKQSFDLPAEFLPTYKITNISSLQSILQSVD